MSAEQAFCDQLVREIHGRSIPISLIYDLGAHKLDESLALSFAFPSAKIVAWEANPELWPVCFAKAGGNIEFINKGVSDITGVMTLNVTEGAGQVSFETPRQVDNWLRVKQRIPIAVERLDSYGQAPSLLWADLQGHEYKAFMGLGEYLKDVSVIATELYLTDRDYEIEHGFDDVDNLLREHFELVAGNPFEGVFDNFIYVNRKFA